MGLLDSVLGAVKGEGGEGSNPLSGVLHSVLSKVGGLSGLSERFKQGGLGSMFADWVGTGPNPPITGEQLHGVLGSDTVNQLASKLGIDGSKVSEMLAKFLPGAIDQLTPNGKIEPNENASL